MVGHEGNTESSRKYVCRKEYLRDRQKPPTLFETEHRLEEKNPLESRARGDNTNMKRTRKLFWNLKIPAMDRES